MNTGNRRSRRKANRAITEREELELLMRDMASQKRLLAKIAPPRVENELVTVVEMFQLSRNAVTVLDTVSNYSFSGNGFYRYNNVATTPIYVNAPQTDQLDLAFKEYKYWTPIRVKIQIFPYKIFQADSAQRVAHQPIEIVHDLDLEIGGASKQYGAKGIKAYAVHAPMTCPVATYANLDRLALQKQQKMTFLTNGTWAAREQPRNPACIQLRMNDPLVFINQNEPFATVKYEL